MTLANLDNNPAKNCRLLNYSGPKFGGEGEPLIVPTRDA